MQYTQENKMIYPLFEVSNHLIIQISYSVKGVTVSKWTHFNIISPSISPRHFLERQLDVGVESLHGDKDQAERTMSMKKFSKSEETAILVATDIASRGLDVKDIRTVINYDVAKNIETYVHRIGRTGQCLITLHHFI